MHCFVSQQNTADALVGRMLQGLCMTEQFLSIDRQEVLLLSKCRDDRIRRHPAQSVCNNQLLDTVKPC